MPRVVQRAVTAAVEYGVARAGIAVVRALDRDIIGHPDPPPQTSSGLRPRRQRCPRHRSRSANMTTAPKCSTTRTALNRPGEFPAPARRVSRRHRVPPRPPRAERGGLGAQQHHPGVANEHGIAVSARGVSRRVS